MRETVGRESVDITTSRVGHPLLVKISYHPRWRAEGADGPYLVSPALMMVVPRQRKVRLFYSSRTVSDVLGAGLTLCALGLGAWSFSRRRVQPRVPGAITTPMTTDACDLPAPTRRWGGVIPAALLLSLVVSRFAVPDRAAAAAREADELRGRATRAQAEGRSADAAEYARHAALRSTGAKRGELLCLRAESLARAGQEEEARTVFAEAAGVGTPCAASVDSR